MRVAVNGSVTMQASVVDRGLQYGQTVFETVAVVNGAARLLDQHYERLSDGADALEIPIDFNVLKDEVNAFIDSDFNSKSRPSVLRITISMGPGGRGYSSPNPEQANPQRILSLHDYPNYNKSMAEQGMLLGLSDVKLSHQPLLAGLKHGNRLEQILARSRWRKGWDEAILTDHLSNVIEGTQSNIIIIQGSRALTPKLDQCGVDGVMKNWAVEHLNQAGFSCENTRFSVTTIEQADAVLMTNSVMGVMPVKQFDSTFFSDFTAANNLRKKLQNDEIIPSY